jgi:branched-chain amino acid aminotransferase
MYYTNDTLLYLDGAYVKAAESKTDLFGQTLHYGYGVFEGIRAYQTDNGTRIFKAKEHFDRLRRSAELVNIPLTLTSEELTQISYNVLEKNNLSNAYLRPLVFCGPNMSLNHPKSVSVMITAWEWGKYLGDSLLRVCTSSYQRPNPKSVKVEAKVCGHYVNSILASSEAKDKGYDEGLLLDMNGFIAEAPGANFFFEKEGKLYTPPLGHILPGITRATVIEIAQELDIPVVEKFFRPEEVYAGDGAFFCGTAAEVIGLESLDEHSFRKEWKGSIGNIIQEAYRCRVLEKTMSPAII